MAGRTLGVIVVVALVLGACGGGGNEGEKDQGEQVTASCGPAPDSVGSTRTVLPNNFPTPDGVTYTGSSTAGPSTIVTAYFDGDLDHAFTSYQDDFHSTGYDVTRSEQDVADAEVAFSGGNTTGEVKMVESCQGRVDLTITIRPD